MSEGMAVQLRAWHSDEANRLTGSARRPLLLYFASLRAKRAQTIGGLPMPGCAASARLSMTMTQQKAAVTAVGTAHDSTAPEMGRAERATRKGPRWPMRLIRLML